MVTWNINGKKVLCPSCYEELTTGVFQRALRWDDDIPDVADRDFFKLFCILTETDYADMERTPENEISIWNAVHWFITQDFKFDKELPKCVEINRKLVDVPQSADALSIGQMIHIRREIETAKYLEEKISFAVAVVLQPVVDDGYFNIKRAKELEMDILKIPIMLTYPIGFFFFRAAERYGRKRSKIWHLIRNNLRQSFGRM